MPEFLALLRYVLLPGIRPTFMLMLILHGNQVVPGLRVHFIVTVVDRPTAARC